MLVGSSRYPWISQGLLRLALTPMLLKMSVVTLLLHNIFYEQIVVLVVVIFSCRLLYTYKNMGDPANIKECYVLFALQQQQQQT